MELTVGCVPFPKRSIVIFLLPTTFRMVLEPAQSAVQCVLGAPSLEVKLTPHFHMALSLRGRLNLFLDEEW